MQWSEIPTRLHACRAEALGLMKQMPWSGWAFRSTQALQLMQRQPRRARAASGIPVTQQPEREQTTRHSTFWSPKTINSGWGMTRMPTLRSSVGHGSRMLRKHLAQLQQVRKRRCTMCLTPFLRAMLCATRMRCRAAISHVRSKGKRGECRRAQARHRVCAVCAGAGRRVAGRARRLRGR